MAFTWLRIRAIELGVTLKAISDESGIEYIKFSKILNGYQKPDASFGKKCKEALERIDRKKELAAA